jgi:hypothetical protein
LFCGLGGCSLPEVSIISFQPLQFFVSARLSKSGFLIAFILHVFRKQIPGFQQRQIVAFFQHSIRRYSQQRQNTLSFLTGEPPQYQPFKAYCSRDATTSLTFNNCTLCPRCIYVFCIYLRTNSDLCPVKQKLIGFYTCQRRL